MTEVFRSRDNATIGHLQSLLESEGIGTYLRNEFASGTTIQIPEVTPALCIVEDADVDRGVRLIRSYVESPDSGAQGEQTCPRCKEVSPGTFANCWSCGADLDS